METDALVEGRLQAIMEELVEWGRLHRGRLTSATVNILGSRRTSWHVGRDMATHVAVAVHAEDAARKMRSALEPLPDAMRPKLLETQDSANFTKAEPMSLGQRIGERRIGPNNIAK